jgi:hypothetical protein
MEIFVSEQKQTTDFLPSVMSRLAARPISTMAAVCNQCEFMIADCEPVGPFPTVLSPAAS